MREVRAEVRAVGPVVAETAGPVVDLGGAEAEGPAVAEAAHPVADPAAAEHLLAATGGARVARSGRPARNRRYSTAARCGSRPFLRRPPPPHPPRVRHPKADPVDAGD